MSRREIAVATPVPHRPVDPTGRRARGLDYASYLRLEQLLSCQQPVSGEPAELLFITVHQTSELWFQLVLHDLLQVRDHLLAARPAATHAGLHRCQVLVGVLTAQLDALYTLTPAEFVRIRPALGTASGAQSSQFRAIEYLCGLHDRLPAANRSAHPDLRPSLWIAFQAAASRLRPGSRRATAPGFAVPGFHHGVEQLLADVDCGGSWQQLVCDLVAFDQRWAGWRSAHLQAVCRHLGDAPGTGGTRGAAWLRSRNQPLFPDLAQLHDLAHPCRDIPLQKDGSGHE